MGNHEKVCASGCAVTAVIPWVYLDLHYAYFNMRRNTAMAYCTRFYYDIWPSMLATVQRYPVFIFPLPKPSPFGEGFTYA